MGKNKERSFFEEYAHEYDLLTNAKQRAKNHAKEVDAIIGKFKPTSVLDAGCATGLTSSLFAYKGIQTVGIDRSRQMIRLAKENYSHYDNLRFQSSSFEKLPKSMYNKFDLIVCLANAISGVETLNNLYKSFMNFNKVLKSGGTLVLQLLNYTSMADGELNPIKATKNGNVIYQRFTERRGKRFYIYVNRLDISIEPPKFEMFRHGFDNFSSREIIDTLKKAHFNNISKSADLRFEKPFGKTSHDLVLTAQK